MCTVAELEPCPFHDLCDVCHPEPEMVERRLKCSSDNCYNCPFYWAYQDGYKGLDED